MTMRWFGLLVVVGGVGWAQGPAATTSAGTLSQTGVYRYDELPVRKMANGGESRDVLKGRLPEGEAVSVHESELPKGVAPNALHRIAHSEVITVISGELEFEHDGKAERVGAGGVIFVGKGTLHTLMNVGNGPARYSVVAVGGDAAH